MPSIPASTLISQLQWRYATKAFDPAQKIEDETWTALEDALVLTPSSFGLQPWKFLVITNPELREQLVPHAWGQRQVADASHFVVMCIRTKIDVACVDAYLQDIASKRGIPLTALDQLRGMMVGFGRMGRQAMVHCPWKSHDRRRTSRGGHLSNGRLCACQVRRNFGSEGARSAQRRLLPRRLSQCG
jgi:nitroreductase